MANAEKIVHEAFEKADIKINGNRPWDIQINNKGFYHRLFKEESIGVGESYMEGWWDCSALDEFVYRIYQGQLHKHVTWPLIWQSVKAKMFNLQNRSGSFKVIKEHYDLSASFYEKFLGKSMAYSCGYWKNASTLDEAQFAKFDLIARKLGLKKGMSLLDLGGGWGGFSKYIAENYGVEVTLVTLSKEQACYAEKFVKGLPVKVILQDYRDATGTFDRVTAIGFCEHIGAKNYRNFMQLVRKCLKDDGLFLNQTIGNNVSRPFDPWHDRYIFPNGHLPSFSEISKASEGLFVMEDWHNFGAHYDLTLMEWFKNCEANKSEIISMYSEKFYRMWKFYLLGCAGGFRSRNMQLWQIVLSKTGLIGGYDSVR